MQDKEFHQTHQLFIEMIINLQIDDMILYDMYSVQSNPNEKSMISKVPVDEKAYRKFEDFDQNYKLFSEAKFILWKLLALIKFSYINLVEFPISKT